MKKWKILSIVIGYNGSVKPCSSVYIYALPPTIKLD